MSTQHGIYQNGRNNKNINKNAKEIDLYYVMFYYEC